MATFCKFCGYEKKIIQQCISVGTSLFAAITTGSCDLNSAQDLHALKSTCASMNQDIEYFVGRIFCLQCVHEHLCFKFLPFLRTWHNITHSWNDEKRICWLKSLDASTQNMMESIMFDLDFFVQVTKMCCIRNCLHYPSIAKFIFKQTDLWKIIFASTELFFDKIVNICEKKKLSKKVDDSWYHLTIAYRALYVTVAELCDCTVFMDQRKWLTLWKSSYFDNVLTFMEYQLEHGFYAYCKAGNTSVMLHFPLIAFGADVLKTAQGIANRKKSMQLGRCRKILTDTFFFNLERMCNENRQFVKRRWAERWMNMKCANIGCNVRRKDNDCLHKCKKCKVMRYCSKKCQKIDWKKNNHKRNCRKFRRMRKKPL